MRLPGEMPTWLSRTLTWGSAAAILRAAVHFFPFLFFPRLVMALASPGGAFEAEVLVRPARSAPIVGGYVTLFSGRDVDIEVRVSRKPSGEVLYRELIATSVRQDLEAEEVEIDWRSDGTVRFNYDQRRNVRVFEPPGAGLSK